MSELVGLTEGERDALACRCNKGICPLHNEASDGYIEHYVTSLLSTVEGLISTRVAAARSEAVRDARCEIAEMLLRFPQRGRHTRAAWAVEWLDVIAERNPTTDPASVPGRDGLEGK